MIILKIVCLFHFLFILLQKKLVAMLFANKRQLIPKGQTTPTGNYRHRKPDDWNTLRLIILIYMKHYQKITCVLLLFLYWGSMSTFAQENTFMLNGKIFEAGTKVQLLECTVDIMSANGDTAIIDSAVSTQEYRSEENLSYTSEYALRIPKKEGDYIIRVRKNGYETATQTISLKDLYHREYSRDIPNIYLQRSKTIDLDEVVVKATKVKFTLKGDTIVYDASAFQLAEGSMLESLIRQLPGTTLTKDGKIYVNGQFVESLLLDGKDFFKGNNRVLLSNLPNYMVNKIDVYRKQGDDSKFTGHRVAGDERYVMDVRLKKQYSAGFSGNVELGGGNDDLYLARLFALRHTNHSRIGVYGNANNLNSSDKPGENTNWSPAELQEGITTLQNGGIDYDIDDMDGRYKISGNVNVAHSKNTTELQTYQTHFINGGNLFNRIADDARKKSFSVSADNRIYLEWKKANLEILPRFSYSNNHNWSDYASILANRDGIFSSGITTGSLFTRQLAGSLQTAAINRNTKQAKENLHGWQAGLELKSIIKFNRIPDYLTLYLSSSYNDTKQNIFDHNLIEYYSQGNLASKDFRNRYFDVVPNRDYSITAKTTYGYIANKNLSINFSYGFDRNYTKSTSMLYLFHQLSGWEEDNSHALGELPSYTAYLHTLDSDNSYESRLRTNRHTIESFLIWDYKTGKSIWQAQLATPLSLQNRELSYLRGSVDTTFTKRNILINIQSTYLKWTSTNYKYQAMLQYALQSQSPDMNMYLNIHDTTNPLNIATGNPHLRTSLYHQVIASFVRIYPAKKAMWAIEGVFKPVQNAIAMSYLYDRQSGVRTNQPMNVNGNWTGNLNIGMSSPVGKLKNINLKTMLGIGYNRSVDYTGNSDMPAPERCIVGTRLLTENIQVDYSLGASASIGLFSDATWGRTTSARQDFSTIKTLEMKNGFTAQVQLPWNMQVSTGMTLYTHHGYTNNALDRNEWVWNARLSYPLANGKWLLQLDGYDILHQLNNVTRTLNAQGIEEKYYNVLPQYVLFHITYNFASKSKSK